MPNRLAAASSPYLLQHRDNPVDWYEWSTDAFAAAALRDVPILLSVGYSACHWCHVMAHESFEDDQTASFMNRHFVNVKVDREERPDVDRIYMDAVQAMTGQGGWPMTVFLTPKGNPFFAGTYFPKKGRGQHPSFMDVLDQIRSAWDQRRTEIDYQAERLTAAVNTALPVTSETPGLDLVRAAIAYLISSYDWEHGGFGGAPKFPQAPTHELLLRTLALGLDEEQSPRVEKMLRTALDQMANGGIYDHLGGGFARYAVDRAWLIPHFEKMLYDNALLARTYLRAWQVTDEERYRTVAIETLDYLARDMRHSDGGIFSAEDADSEGVEGKYYVWDWAELETLLGDDTPLIAAVFGASRDGNFEGSNILSRPSPIEVIAQRFNVELDDLAARTAKARTLLLTARAARVRPGLDDKIIAAWNGLAMRAFAESGAILGREDYIDVARGIAAFLRDHLTVDGRLQRSWREGAISVPGFCDDYGAVAVGLFTLYQATGELEWYAEAERLSHDMINLFADPAGGFFATGNDAEKLIARPKNLFDNPTPSDNALAAEALQILWAYTGETTLADTIEGVGRAAGRILEHYPHASGHLLSVLATFQAGLKAVAIVGKENLEILRQVAWEQFRPNCIVASSIGPSHDIPLLINRSPGPNGALAYVCRNFVCDLPVSTTEELRGQL